MICKISSLHDKSLPVLLHYEYNTMVQVGRDCSYIPTGGGTGTVVLDLVLNKDITPQPETFNIMVAVGSDEKDGVKIEGPDYIEISIPLMGK